MDKRYKFILLSNDSSQRLELEQAPIGWDASKFNVLRDLVYFGIMKTISVEYEFVGDGFTFLQRQRLIYGMDANIILRVYKRTKFLFEGKINFENYNEDRRDRKFKVDIIQSSFVQKFKNREDVKLNIRNNIGLDRQPVAPALYQDALFRGKKINFYSEFEGSTQTTFDKYHGTLPFFLKVNGNPGVNGVSNINPDTWAPDTFVIENDRANPMIDNENAFYENVLSQSQTIQLDLSWTYSAIYKGAVDLSPGNIERNHIIFRLLKVNLDNSVDSQLYYSDVEARDYNISFSLSHSYSSSITLTPGQYLIALMERWGKENPIEANQPLDVLRMDGSLLTEITYTSMSMTITQDSIVTDTTHPVILPLELFTSLIQQINGGTFTSNFFGRIDAGYYEDGEGAYVGITKGELLRGIDPDTVQISTSFREAFSSYSSLFCLGAIITKNGIQVEPLQDLLNNSVAADIGEISKLQIVPAKDYLFNSVKAGYPINEYEQENGRDEFNTLTQYTNSFQAVKKELDISSKYFADGYGIEFARRASVSTTGSQDSRYDDKIFLVSLMIDEYDGTLQTKRLESVLDVSGIFSPETAINLDIAAGQNILRWKKFLNIPLHRKPDKKLYFQSKDKNAQLRLVTELGTSNDGEDINLGSTAFFLPEERIGQCPITIDNLFAILANPLGRIKYTYEGEKFYDYLFEADSEVEKVITQWRFLGTKATPILSEEEFQYENFIKYADGLQDFIQYGNFGDNLLYN